MILSIDYLSQEKQSELLGRLKACCEHERMVIETILKYMSIYEKALQTRRAGDSRLSQNFLNLLTRMPDEINLKRATWIKSLNYVIQFSEYYGKIIDSTQEAASKVDEVLFQKDSLSFEEMLLMSIRELEELIETWQKATFEENKKQCQLQIIAWKEAKQGWEKILEQRQNLLKLGGNDFFKLFE